MSSVAGLCETQLVFSSSLELGIAGTSALKHKVSLAVSLGSVSGLLEAEAS